ncbi:MAG: Asp-tRNA(Asn)/Glu-tRNA(Gln) amidotransferase subunit GatC [Candidatus Omnitrophica bacterium]|nr:Asp-tRNA(Asn)/Glu-tRNA(Gln) amidotransferase subunit GatC [Candidatus Omnitrophota bacterium]
MALSKETVRYVADLSRIELRPEELEELSRQLEAILEFIDQLDKADIAGVEPTSHVAGLANVMRDDVPVSSLPVEKTLANAPHKEGGYFVVPKVIE